MLSLLEMSITGGILIAAIVIVRAAAGQRLPRGAFLALWWVAISRLLLPFSLPSPTSVYQAAQAFGPSAGRPGIATGGGTALPALAEPAAGPEGPGPLLLLWGAAGLALAGFFLVTHLRARRDYRASLPVEDPFVARWLAEHPLRRNLQVRCSDRIDTPLAYGVFRPVILLPKTLNRADEHTLAFVLAHELAHIRRWDGLTRCLLCAAACVHWFNPLVWVMLLLAGRDMEVSCDQIVVRMYGPQARAPYARALLDLESKRTRLLPLASGFSRSALEERIGAIMKSRKASLLGLFGAVILVAAVTAVFATSAPKQTGRTASGPDVYTAEALDRALNLHGTTAVIQDGVIASVDWGWTPEKDPETGRYYTKKQYGMMEALQFEGYADLSIAEFNRKLNAALFGGDSHTEEVRWAYEAVLNDLPEDDPLAPFLRNTVQASITEYNARFNEVCSGKRTDPDFYGQISRTDTADVFGDRIEVGWTQASYQFTYRILDQDKLTVAERDAFLQAVLNGMQAYLDGRNAKTLGKREDMAADLLAELDRLGKAASTGEVEYTGGKIGDYYSESFFEEGTQAAAEGMA